LKSGDVIPLDPEILQHLRVSLAQKPKFVATMGRCGPRWAAKITKVLEA
jgi:flagellar motor switch protein FliM